MKIITKKLGEKYHKKKGIVKVRLKLWMEFGKGAGGGPSKAIVILLKNQVLVAEAVCLRFLMADCTMIGEIFCFQP